MVNVCQVHSPSAAMLTRILRARAFFACQQQSRGPRRVLCTASNISGRDFLVLGIESSCDDTGVAIVSSSGTILGEALATQAHIHAAWGGVVPKLAQEAHAAAIDSCVEKVFSQAGISASELDAVAVTIGPGLSLCLRIGAMKARQLSTAHPHLPIIPVHHMEAHALVARLPAGHLRAGHATPPSSPTFPFLCLLVSGGHNLILIVEGVGRYVQLGTTLDDALGEAYDKVARLLGLQLIPCGGAALEALARQGDPDSFKYTQPMQKRKTCDFSYAGLKTAVRLSIEQHLGDVELPAPETPDQDPNGYRVRANIAASFQRVAVGHLEERCRRAIGWAKETHPSIQHLVVAGGVASNTFVRSRLSAVTEEYGLTLVCPPPRLCTDNGVMVAWAGIEQLMSNCWVENQSDTTSTTSTQSSSDEEWIDLRPRWPLTDRKDPRSFQAPRSAKKKNIFASLEQLTSSG